MSLLASRWRRDKFCSTAWAMWEEESCCCRLGCCVIDGEYDALTAEMFMLDVPMRGFESGMRYDE